VDTEPSGLDPDTTAHDLTMATTNGLPKPEQARTRVAPNAAYLFRGAIRCEPDDPGLDRYLGARRAGDPQ
jgi:hypothetical protein